MPFTVALRRTDVLTHDGLGRDKQGSGVQIARANAFASQRITLLFRVMSGDCVQTAARR